VLTDPSLPIVGRRLRSDADWWRLRGLLSELGALTPPGFAWNVRRLDGRRFSTVNPVSLPAVQLWETRDGRLVAAICDESPGEAHLQVHPGFRVVEPELIGWAEHALSEPAGDATRHRLELPVGENDELRLGLLRERGYEETPSCGATYRLLLGRRASPRRRLYGGYVLRNTQPTDPLDCRQIAGLLNAAFSRTFHTPEEYATFARLAPSFRADLDLVAVAPDGTFAAYVGASYDEAGRRGILEPVCTAPGHRRRGLARALIEEGLCRLEARGAVDAVVETGSGAAANALYAGLGLTESYRATTWRRVW